MKQHTLTHKSHEIAAAAAAAAANRSSEGGEANDGGGGGGGNNGSSSASDGRPDSASREDSNSSPLLEAGLKRSPAEDPAAAVAEPLPKRLHGKKGTP